MKESDLYDAVDNTFAAMEQARQDYAAGPVLQEAGEVVAVRTGIAMVSGLPGAAYDELLAFPHGLFGIALDLDEDLIGVVLLGNYEQLRAGDRVDRTGRVVDVPVGDALIGRVVDPLGRPLDNKGTIRVTERLPVERPAPGILDRDPVTEPLQTGIKVIDAMIPVGRGQRELILGDRQTGKTAIAVSAILNQQAEDVVCIYCAIGQRAAGVARVVAQLTDAGAMDHTIVVVAEGNDAPGLNFIAPYAATSMGEYFMEKGRDVLVVYDDLTHHARSYREISLLLRRPPGREAFPGDIFFVHSRLLERATHLKKEKGGGSLTALPVIETEAQHISAYIPTNLISITDGQIFLSPSLFEKGVLPAVDAGKSVSRVGSKAQLSAYHAVTGKLKLDYAQFEELEQFARFGTRLDEHSRQLLTRGQRVREVLRQLEGDLLGVPEQIMVLLALVHGAFDPVAITDMQQAELAVRNAANRLPADVLDIISANEAPDDDATDSMLQLAKEALRPFTEKEKASKNE